MLDCRWRREGQWRREEIMFIQSFGLELFLSVSGTFF
jgi:hypothetical protein